jgi:hypothetical protein
MSERSDDRQDAGGETDVRAQPTGGIIDHIV